MYFTNIGDKELKPFHKDESVDISISLTEILSSDLFQVETIITDSLYRVFPLFYCNTITSSNSNDKILNNRCLILQKMEHETYLSFSPIQHENNIIFNEDVVNSYDIGDSLTVEEFNGLVSLLRRNKTFHDVINISEENQYLDNDINVELNLNANYTYNKLSNINLKGTALNKKDESVVSNKTFLVYALQANNEYKFSNSVDTNKNGEYNFVDYGVNSYYDNTAIGSRNDLQALIDTAIDNNESEINLTQQYKFNNGDAPLEIDSPIIIKGNGHIIDANSKTRIFNVTGDNVTIKNVILKSGNINDVGGAIKWTGDNGLLTEVIIADCIANGNGGAVYWTGASGVIDGCKVINNATNSKGGGFYIECSGFKLLNIISFNNYSNDSGGCVYLVGDGNLIDTVITQKDTSNGSHPTIINSIGNNNNIRNVTANSPFFGRNYEDRTTRTVNNEFNYKLVPSTWIKGDSEDYAVKNSFNNISKVNKSFTGVMDEVMIFKGKYADYKIYNLNNQLKNDKGVIINDKIKNNPLKIQLMNNYFKTANYNLKGTVSTVNDVNIDNNSSNEINIEDINVLLDTEVVEIPLTDFENDSIFNNDIIIDIDFNSPEIKYPEVINLSASSETIFSDESVVLTARYIENNNPVYNAPITFKDGNTVIGTVNTDIEGIAVLNYTPTGLGAHSITAEYNTIHSESIIVTVINYNEIQLSTSKSIVASGDSVNLTAQLLLNSEIVEIAGVNIDFKINDVVIGSATTDATGKALLTYTPLVVSLIYASDSIITSNSVTIDIIDDIDLSSDKSILSYSDGDSASLSAQLQYLGEDVAVSGVSVDFEIYDENDTLLDTLSDDTDNTGLATVSYHSNNAGNINIKAVVSNVYSNNLQIEDISYYKSLTSQINDFEVTRGYSTLTYSSNGLAVFTSSGGDSFVTNTGYELPNNFILEFTITGLIVGDYNTTGGITVNGYSFEKANGVTSIVKQSNGNLISTIDCFDENTVIKIIQQNSTMQIYKNDVLKYTLTNTISSQYFAIKSFTKRGITIKDLKIKEL